MRNLEREDDVVAFLNLDEKVNYDNNFLPYKKGRRPDDALPSSHILWQAIKEGKFSSDPIVDIRRIMQMRQPKTTLWALKKEGDTFSIEYYFFYPSVYSSNTLSSVSDLFSLFSAGMECPAEGIDYYLLSITPSENRIDFFEFYSPVLDGEDNPLDVFGTGLFLRRKDPVIQCYKYDLKERSVTRLNSYYPYAGERGFGRVAEKIVSLCRRKFPDEDPAIALRLFDFDYVYDGDRVICPSAIKDKEGGGIGVYLGDIGFDSFMRFLRSNRYPEGFVSDIEEKRNRTGHLKFEIGFDFVIRDGQLHVLKTTFWGVI